MSGMNDPVVVTETGPVTVLTLNEPDRANPLSSAMAAGLTRELERARRTGVRSVVITGAGRHFSAGADLAALERIADKGSAEDNLADSRRLEALFAELLSHPALTVAAVNGAAIAGGCGLATACDLVVAGPKAKFAYTEVKIGFIPALVSTFLTRRVTGSVARRLLLDPEILDAEQAAAVGLVDELCGDEPVLEAACRRAETVCRKASPAAIAATKALMLSTADMPWRKALATAAEANAEQRQHAECRLGVRSFLETKATPDWLE